ncbi:DUF5009 domain-containing protein [soil metagenome]
MKPRNDALDELRGMAILAMMLSGTIPFGVLADWMYHAQSPPPTHQHNPSIPGITWVDLVFPTFLFAMGAAIPLAMRKAEFDARSVWKSLSRGCLLISFGVYIQHLRPYILEKTPTTATWLTALLGFALAIPMFARLPEKWPKWTPYVVRAVGWGAAAGLLSRLRYVDGTGFQPDRADVIILVLATCAAVGGLIYLATKGKPMARLMVLLALAAWRLAAESDNTWASASWWWERGVVGALARPEFLGYLLVVIPGTFVGEALSEEPGELNPWWGSLAVFLGFAAPILVVTVWFHRLSPLLFLPLGMMVFITSGRERSIATIGAVCLALGTLIEPFQEGIKKDPPTFSYWLTGAGTAALILVALMLLPAWKPRRLLATVGQNPMLAYIGITNLVAPLWALTLGAWIDKGYMTPQMGVVSAWAQTILLLLFVSLFSRFKIYLRT